MNHDNKIGLVILFLIRKLIFAKWVYLYIFLFNFSENTIIKLNIIIKI